MIKAGNIREIIGQFIGAKLVDITQKDAEEAGDMFVRLLFDNGQTLTFYSVDAELYGQGPIAFSTDEQVFTREDYLWTPTKEEKAGGKWAVVQSRGDDYPDMHIMPTFGKLHYMKDDCWCSPRIETDEKGERTISHNEEGK